MPFKFNSKNLFVLLVKVFPGLTNVKTTNISVCKKKTYEYLIEIGQKVGVTASKVLCIIFLEFKVPN